MKQYKYTNNGIDWVEFACQPTAQHTWQFEIVQASPDLGTRTTQLFLTDENLAQLRIMLDEISRTQLH